MVTGAPSVNVRLGFHAISANIGSYVQEAGPILLKAVVGVVLGLGQQGMQPRICFHPDPCRGRDFPNCHWSVRLREKSATAMPVRSCAARTVNRARQAVLHQPAPHFLHGDDGRFLGRRG